MLNKQNPVRLSNQTDASIRVHVPPFVVVAFDGVDAVIWVDAPARQRTRSASLSKFFSDRVVEIHPLSPKPSSPAELAGTGEGAAGATDAPASSDGLVLSAGGAMLTGAF